MTLGDRVEQPAQGRQRERIAVGSTPARAPGAEQLVEHVLGPANDVGARGDQPVGPAACGEVIRPGTAPTGRPELVAQSGRSQ